MKSGLTDLARAEALRRLAGREDGRGVEPGSGANEGGSRGDGLPVAPDLAAHHQARYDTGIAGRLLEAAAASLSSQDYAPQTVRTDKAALSQLLLATAWLLDSAAALLAGQVAELSKSDPDWRYFVDKLDLLLAAESNFK